jgi:hypothetical protein
MLYNLVESRLALAVALVNSGFKCVLARSEFDLTKANIRCNGEKCLLLFSLLKMDLPKKTGSKV